MKKNLFFIAIIVTTIASCVKDRIPPVAPPVITSNSDTLMYYWSFHNQDSSKRSPDFAVNSGAIFNYWASYIDYVSPGCDSLNVWNVADTGTALRVRNPSDSIVFYMPTTGYDSVVLTFAEEASSTTSGSTINYVRYTTDGVNYISTALTANGGSNSCAVGTTFALYKFSFAADPATNNNPKFAVSIVMGNNNTGTSGNDRFDNVSLQGVRK